MSEVYASARVCEAAFENALLCSADHEHASADIKKCLLSRLSIYGLSPLFGQCNPAYPRLHSKELSTCQMRVGI